MPIVTKNGKPLIYEKESYILRGMWFNIYNEIGPGHKESVYGNAFEKLLEKDNVPYFKISDYKLGFIVNFGTAPIEIIRRAHEK